MSFLRNLKAVVVAVMLGLPACAALAEVVVVVSAKNPVTSLSESQVANIFLGRAGYFPSGEEAVPLNLPEDSPLRTDFYRDCTGKSASQLRAYWSKLIFTGRAQPPREMTDAAAVKRYLQTRPAAIAYLDKKDVDASVKVVLSPRP